ncbi:MAG: DUF1800 domain-containing protein [Planctomycetes bacterium]|nr:DUF1800 domain-containing protein [Planctomycetota bacterium]
MAQPHPGLRQPAARARAGAITLLLLAACGGGGGVGGDSQNESDHPASTAEAVRFLTQATFGPDEQDLASVQQLGYRAWMQEQAALPASSHRQVLEARAAGGVTLTHGHRQSAWWKHVLTGRDQLRQRMAFALSEIFVVSDQSDALGADILGAAEYYDLLSRHAFGNYRQLLEAVTLSPQMGRYLSHLRNRNPDPGSTQRPDENYAREVMQLFSIGLVQLEPDGAVRIDGQGQPIPTYTQDDITALSYVLTGWHYAGASTWWSYTENWSPMEPWEAHHSQAQKTILGTQFPAGRTARDELMAVLDLLAAHPNVGPFLGKQLIQRFVTSNPSPAYVRRVATVWNNDGHDHRGNLQAVLRAVLLDDEARHGHERAPTTFGKLKEPLLQQSAMWRALRARCDDGHYTFTRPDATLGQAALRSPTVFNFFRPDHAPQGAVATAGLVAPEFEIVDHTMSLNIVNQLYASIYWYRRGNSGVTAADIVIDATPEEALAGDVDALLDHLDERLLAGAMSDSMRALLRANLVQESDLRRRTQDAIYLIVSSPEFAVQK